LRFRKHRADTGDGCRKSTCQRKGGDLISEICLLLYTTAVVDCYVVKKGKARREETPTILGKN